MMSNKISVLYDDYKRVLLIFRNSLYRITSDNFGYQTSTFSCRQFFLDCIFLYSYLTHLTRDRKVMQVMTEQAVPSDPCLTRSRCHPRYIRLPSLYNF